MGVPYDVFSGAFLGKITERNFPQDRHLTMKIVDGYMKRAIAQFKHICLYDLSTTGDDVVREFKVSIESGDLEELADIISEGMLVQWMKPYVNRSDSYENLLSTRDYTVHSPSELIKAMRADYTDTRRAFMNMMREYSYNHGDLTELHL